MSRKVLVPLLLPADPTVALEAATKQYVDAHAGGGGMDQATADARYVNVDGDTMIGQLLLPALGDLSLSSTTHPLQIGSSASANMRFDNNEFQAVNNGAAADLWINYSGGKVRVGASGIQSYGAFEATAGPENRIVRYRYSGIEFYESDLITPATVFFNLPSSQMSGELYMNNFPVTGLPNPPPTAASATSKAYTDATYVSRSGSVMTGNLTMGANPFTGNANGAVLTPDAFLRMANNVQGQAMLWLKLRSPAITTGERYVTFLRTDNNDVVGSISIASATGINYNATSDHRLKDELSPLSGALGRVGKLRPIRYRWKNDPDTDGYDGFLAHEVAEVVPEAVTGGKDAVNEDGTIDPQQLDQSRLIPLLTAAIKDLSAKVASLSIRVHDLEQVIA